MIGVFSMSAIVDGFEGGRVGFSSWTGLPSARQKCTTPAYGSIYPGACFSKNKGKDCLI